MLQVAALRDWLQLVLRCELPAGQLPELLRDGEVRTRKKRIRMHKTV